MIHRMKIFPFVLSVTLIPIFLDLGSMVVGHENVGSQILKSLADEQGRPAPATMELSVKKATEILGRLQSELAEHAFGVVLSKELLLDELAQELKLESPNADKLRQIEGSLRRILPGHVQKTVDELRNRIRLLSRQISYAAEDRPDFHNALEVLTHYLRDTSSTLSEWEETKIRNAFHTLADQHIDIDRVALLRNHLSQPNYLSRVRSEFLIRESKQSFAIPIEFCKSIDNTTIAGDGNFQVHLALEIPPSHSDSFLRLHANGKGFINVTAQRTKAQVCATIEPKINGSQGVHLRVKDISADPPWVKAALQTNLTGVNIDGILGKSRIVQNVAKRAVQKKLSDNDTALAAQIEKTVASRVEEEAYQLAYKINGVIRHGVWDRLGSLDFIPDVKIYNDERSIHNKTVFARLDQLGALQPPPIIPPALDPILDITTWVHESATNNVFQSLGGKKIDEATLRGLLQVECKLTSDEWERVQPAKEPTVLSLANDSPLKLRFLPDVVEFNLHVEGLEWAGRPQDVKPCQLKIGYRLDFDIQGIRFTRQEIEFSESVTPEDQQAWMKAFDGFLPKVIRPLPRFNNRLFKPFIRVEYLKIDSGWIVVGASRISPTKDAKSE